MLVRWSGLPSGGFPLAGDTLKLFGEALKLCPTKLRVDETVVARLMTRGMVTTERDVTMGDPQPNTRPSEEEGAGSETKWGWVWKMDLLFPKPKI